MNKFTEFVHSSFLLYLTWRALRFALAAVTSPIWFPLVCLFAAVCAVMLITTDWIDGVKKDWRRS